MLCLCRLDGSQVSIMFPSSATTSKVVVDARPQRSSLRGPYLWHKVDPYTKLPIYNNVYGPWLQGARHWCTGSAWKAGGFGLQKYHPDPLLYSCNCGQWLWESHKCRVMNKEARRPSTSRDLRSINDPEQVELLARKNRTVRRAWMIQNMNHWVRE